MTPPGSTLGILGGGQLGRMCLLGGAPLGYRYHVFDPDPSATAAHLAHRAWSAPYEDLAAVREFAASCDVLSLEFENVPAACAEAAAQVRPLHPSPRVLAICQNRLQEKTFLREAGFPHAEFREVESMAEFCAAVEALGVPCVLKTAAWGYDGKGQRRIAHPNEAAPAWQSLDVPKAIVEAWVDFQAEYSVIVARSATGETATFPLFRNEHRNHILHLTSFPAPLEESLAADAAALALAVAEKLAVVGLLTVELFLSKGGRWLVNELAPRPHNSGHVTIEACATSQFEQHTRAICGLPLGSTHLRQPGVMVNLLGELWQAGEPDWAPFLRNPAGHLHLYGKGEARPGRKMGHYTMLADDLEQARETALGLWQASAPSPHERYRVASRGVGG